MSIDTTPRRSVAATIVAPSATIVASAAAADAPVLSGEAVPFREPSGAEYTLNTARVLGFGGQGIVVEAADKAGNRLAAKLSFQPQSVRDRLARRAILGYLRALVAEHPLGHEHFRETHLMPLLATGQVSDTVEGLGTTTYDVEIMPVCEGELARRTDVSFEEIRDTILPQAACALHLLHEQRIVHRDVKPKNLYLLDGSVVLGDFGISSVLDEGRDTSSTKIDRRTPGFSPHSSTVQCANDWYALGYTIWTLYNKGVHPHQMLIDHDDLSSVLAGARPVAFQAHKPEHASLGELIYGLTYAHARGRLGYDAVESWLANPAAFSYRDPIEGGAHTARGYQFEGALYRDDASLAHALAASWDRAERHLYTQTLEDHFRAMGQNDLAVALNDIVEVHPATIANHDVGTARACALIAGETTTLFWKGHIVPLGDIGALLGQLSREDKLDLLSSGILAWTAFRALGAGDALYTTFEKLSEDAVLCPEFALAWAENALGPDGEGGANDREADGSASGEGVGNGEAQRLFDALTATPATFYRRISQDMPLMRALGELAARSSYGPCAEMAHWIVNNPIPDGVAGKQAVRDLPSLANRAARLIELLCALGASHTRAADFWVAWGPSGYATWEAENASAYQPLNAEGERIMSEIAQAHARAKSACAQATCFADARRAQASFADTGDGLMVHLVESPYLHELGITGACCIDARDANGYLTASLAGHPIPRGFANALADASDDDAKSAAWLRSAIAGSRDAALRKRAAETAREAADKLERIAGDISKTSAYGGDSRVAFAAKAIAGVAFVLAVAMLWPDFTLMAWQTGDARTIGPIDLTPIPTSTLTVPAFWAFLAAAATVIARKVALATSAGATSLSKSRAEETARKVREAAKRIEAGKSAATAWSAGSAHGNAPVEADADDALARGEKALRRTSAPAPVLTALFWIGAASCAALMLAASVSGAPAFIVDATDFDLLRALSPAAAQYIYIGAAVASFAVVAAVRRAHPTMPTLAMLCLAPIMLYIAIAAGLAALVIALVIFVLYIIFGR